MSEQEQPHNRISKVQVKERDFFIQRGIRVPDLVFRQQPFRFRPQSFTVYGPRMQEKLYDASLQNISLHGFLQAPLMPVVYGVSSQSNPARSNYMAAFLVQKFCEATHGSNSVQWIRPADNLNSDIVRGSPSLLVISGLTPNTPSFRLDRVYQLLDEWDHIPRIVVMSGEDPLTFFSTRLFYKVDRIYFHDEGIVQRNPAAKRVQEV